MYTIWDYIEPLILKDVLGMYRGKTIVLLGNEFATGEFARSSVTDSIDVAEISKLAAQGTSVLVCDVEMSRSADIRRWLGDVVHRTSNIPGAHMFMEPEDVVECLRLKRDDTRYITSPKVGVSWEKGADKFLRLLSKQFPSRRFLMSKHDESRICVRESLDLNCRVAIFFSHGSIEPAASQYTFISILPFSTRLSLLWSFFTKTHPYAKIAEYLSISIANDLLAEQKTGDIFLLSEFLTFNPCQFNSNSVYFVAVILSAISYGRGLRKKSSRDDIQQFSETHYSSDLQMVLASRLRWQRRLSLKDMRGKISAACGIDVNEYNSHVAYSSDVESEIRETVTRRKGRNDDARVHFEKTFQNCFDELLEFIPASLTR
jgi:gas vesicle protein